MIINIKSVVFDAYELLMKDYRFWHLVLFLFLVPLGLGILTFQFVRLSDTFINGLLTFISIIVGFLVNISVVLFNSDDKNSIVRHVRKATYPIVHYTILVGIILVLITLLRPQFSIELLKFIDALLIFFFVHFLVLLLNIFKGFYAIFKGNN